MQTVFISEISKAN